MMQINIEDFLNDEEKTRYLKCLSRFEIDATEINATRNTVQDRELFEITIRSTTRHYEANVITPQLQVLAMPDEWPRAFLDDLEGGDFQ